MISSTLPIELSTLSNFLGQEDNHKLSNYFREHVGEWQILLTRIEEAGEVFVAERPVLARNLIRITPSSLENWPLARRVRNWALKMDVLGGLSFSQREDCLLRLVRSKDTELLAALLPTLSGPSLPLMNAGTRSTLLHEFARNGFVEGMELLLEAYPDMAMDGKDGDGNAPLHLAAAGGKLEAARFLLEHSADLHALGHQRYTALHFATASARADAVVRLLVEKGAPLNLQADDGATPLHHLARRDKRELYQLLIDAGADATLYAHQGRRPGDSRDPFRLMMRMLNAVPGAGPQLAAVGAAGQRLMGNDLGPVINWAGIAEIEPPDEAPASPPPEPPEGFASLGFTNAHVAAFFADRFAMVQASLNGELTEKDAQGRTPLELAAEMGHWELFEAALVTMFAASPGELGCFFVDQPKVAKRLQERLSEDQGMMLRWRAAMDSSEKGESFKKALSHELFFKLASLFSPSELRERALSLEPALRWEEIQTGFRWLSGGVGNFLLCSSNPHHPSHLLQEHVEAIKTALNDYMPHQIALMATDHNLVGIFSLVLDCLSPWQLDLVIPQMDNSLFNYVMDSTSVQLRQAYLLSATCQQREYWLRSYDKDHILGQLEKSYLKSLEGIQATIEALLNKKIDAEVDSLAQKKMRVKGLKSLHGRIALLKCELGNREIYLRKLKRALTGQEMVPSLELRVSETVGAGLNALQRIRISVAEMEALLSHQSLQIEQVPDHFICPISREPMRDPVMAKDGCVYDRANIERWIAVAERVTSPMTGLPLERGGLEPQKVLRGEISDWLALHPGEECDESDSNNEKAHID